MQHRLHCVLQAFYQLPEEQQDGNRLAAVKAAAAAVEGAAEAAGPPLDTKWLLAGTHTQTECRHR